MKTLEGILGGIPEGLLEEITEVAPEDFYKIFKEIPAITLGRTP